MTAEDLDTGGVFLFSRPNGMLLVVPPSKHHQSEADLRHRFALAMRVLPMSEDTPGPCFAWQGGPCFSYAKREVSGHNDIPQELWAFLLKRVKWLKVPFHVTQVIYNLYPGTDHPQGPNCRPTLPPAPVESTSQATKLRKREKGLDSTAAVNSKEVQH